MKFIQNNQFTNPEHLCCCRWPTIFQKTVLEGLHLMYWAPVWNCRAEYGCAWEFWPLYNACWTSLHKGANSRASPWTTLSWSLFSVVTLAKSLKETRSWTNWKRKLFCPYGNDIRLLIGSDTGWQSSLLFSTVLVPPCWSQYIFGQ